ncbi:MAG: 16S rRNA (adenine(1518)-N(6)/adenine(1519)-N(6))-dimethyltransferase RsmA [Clostridia bacterium]|nr:16S rRNA (adenine(1518)-N(6)/adenine(1519)-N(6))-dimethyltransferase RsmA [Clostridia bacterium]
MSTLLEETKLIMNKFHIKANKSLGQNFLICEEVVQAIIESSKIQKEDLVIEIGPGLGTLTKYLLEKAGKVICIELDKKMVNLLESRFLNNENFVILNQDVLKVDLRSIIQKETTPIKNVKVVANLPYYITTPIIMKLLEDELPLESITVMIQKEVANRLLAIPGQRETGAITYSVYYYAQSEGVLEVPNHSFIPEPEVTSKVIKLNIRKKPPVEIEKKEMMFQIIKCAFMQRRKTLLNALANTNMFSNKNEGIEILKNLNIDINIRPEKLKLEDYANLTKLIMKKRNLK